MVGAAATAAISVAAFVAQFFVPALLSAVAGALPAASENDSPSAASAWWLPVTV